ncbi:DUF1049 domain-containing protein [Wenzhouxiangella sp. AB-CW3]|uniref:lipopolysaccharide assembly protein LapA domain-containing protein n=1 Tax=Wenzhouxiangella sp. AB-CW3 TaxID=2771012 RepID=UPI00168A49CD|nr:lipopolysaccharide assembly protein LapA domain-containing protein [Wenzhouxiangella sp. AB-CW3]QOC21650.1 DUF1049 domain-containing protein [Wenzhouxiangella sp. AB-CW3]
MYRWVLLILVLAAIITGLVVGVLNADTVQLDLLAFTLSLPLGAMVLACLGLGVLFGLLMAAVMFVLPARLARQGRGDSPTSPDRSDPSNA